MNLLENKLFALNIPVVIIDLTNTFCTKIILFQLLKKNVIITSVIEQIYVHVNSHSFLFHKSKLSSFKRKSKSPIVSIPSSFRRGII